MAVKEFMVSSTHVYKVRLAYDETKYNGNALAVAAIQNIDADHPAICDEGDQDLSTVWSDDIPPKGEAILTLRELLEAGVDEEDILKFSPCEMVYMVALSENGAEVVEVCQHPEHWESNMVFASIDGARYTFNKSLAEAVAKVENERMSKY